MKKFIDIYFQLINNKFFKLKFNKKNLFLLLHYTLRIYLNKSLKN